MPGRRSAAALVFVTVLCAVAMAACSGPANQPGSGDGYPPVGYPTSGETDRSFETLPAHSGCFTYHAATDKRAYAIGETISFTVVATNTTDRPCQGRTCFGITPGFTVTDSHNREVYTKNPVGVACMVVSAPPPMVAPGASANWDGGRWDQRSDYQGCVSSQRLCATRVPLPPGRYRITWHWVDKVRAQTDWFTIEAS